MAFSRLDAIPEDPGGCRDDHGRDDEREHGSVDRSEPTAGQGFTIGPIAGQEDDRSGGSSRKYAANVKLPDSGALVPHRQRPNGKENGNKVVSCASAPNWGCSIIVWVEH